EHLFPEDEDEPHPGRIPIVGVAGTRGTATIARAVAWLIHLGGYPAGLACRDGLYLNHRRVERGNQARWEAGHRLLMNRDVQAAVFENGPDSILDHGLAYDRCQVGVVTDLDGAQALERHDIRESDQLLKVLRTQVDVVLGDGVGVLNAADERIADLAELCDGEVLLYGIAGPQGLPAAIEPHRAQGGRAVILRDGRVLLATGTAETPCVDLAGMLRRRGATSDARLPEALLAAIAAAWAFGISPDLIAAGIETFDLSPPHA
ncbi:MAG TPA: cyanophycin synthetase, partial [Ideonella sp.]|nr:cyanophycin synthetase [Ideonella sp.]